MNLTKGLLSVVILFQLFIVLIGPNQNTYVGQVAAPAIVPYLNALELGSSWNFFAPDPGPPPLQLEWELLGAGNEIVGTGVFPDRVDPFLIRERQNRRIALARFLFYSDERHLKIWGEYLCRMNPSAVGVRLWKTLFTIPNLFDVQSGKRRIGDDEGGTRTSIGTHFCTRPSEEGRG